MIKKRTICTALILSIACIITGGVYATAIDEKSELNPIFEYAIDVITGQYTDNYVISDENIEILSEETLIGATEYYAVVTFGRTLHETKATDLPYIAGMISAAPTVASLSYSVANDYITSWINELENEYIGQVQNTSVYIYITVPNFLNAAYSIEDQVTVSVENMLGELVSPDVLKPKSDNTLFANGQATITSIATEAASRGVTSINADIEDYDRIAARDYALKYSCKSGLSYNHDCHNPNYDFIDYADCANFVSQCLYEGGLTTDSTWDAYTGAWKIVDDLKAYLIDNNLFFESTNEMRAFAGSIISWNGEDHVGLVDKNDTETMTFSAHTKCRNACGWAGEDVSFWIPYWDSYNEEWVDDN